MLRIATILIALCLFAEPALAGKTVTYNDGETVLEGWWEPARCELKDSAPVVLIVHQWMGLTDYERMRASKLADKCYNAFAIDMYGQGVRPTSKDEARTQSSIYKDDPDLARGRLVAALDFARMQTGVDEHKVAAFGYCFGGSMVLELARSGADVSGVVSFHGGLSTKAPVTVPGVVKSAVQVHNGAEDIAVSDEDISTFKAEMDAAGVVWQFNEYADAVHAFTQPKSGDDPSDNIAYNKSADIRSWAAALAFLEEIFAD